MLNVISSKGYLNFLPKAHYHVLHNMPCDVSSYTYDNNVVKRKIQISYIGLIRFMDMNIRVINLFKNDSRFELNCIGTNSELIIEYCLKNRISNVHTVGTFPKEMTAFYYKKSDIIMNLYGNHTPLLDYALSNKLYLSALSHKPILVSPDTYMEEIVSEYGLGCCIDITKDKCGIMDWLYEWYTHLDYNEFSKRCDLFIYKIMEEQKETIKMLSFVLSDNKLL